MGKKELVELVSRYTEVPKKLNEVEYRKYKNTTYWLEYYIGDWYVTVTYMWFCGEWCLDIEKKNAEEWSRKFYYLGTKKPE